MTGQQHVEISSNALFIHPGQQWAPVAGEELERLLETSPLDGEARNNIKRQSVAVLSQGVPPSGTGAARRTGLVVGYVQSGKTLSFTSVIALAHDNQVPLVILLAGTKRNLHKQTRDRLEHDLDMRRSDGSPWLMVSDPRPVASTVQEVAVVLRDRLAPKASKANPLLAPFGQERRTIVMTVMKNAKRLDNLRRTLVAVSEQGVDLTSLPVLIVDDEADQAGLNTRAGDEEEPSATYRALRDLRDAIPRHTYLEYTATPQAPLLLNLLDTLAPDYVAVLVPGKGYTGGEYFFREHRDQFVETLPQHQADEAADEDAQAPPECLQQALATYLVASLLMGTRGVVQSSMLVHPSHTRDLHDRYAHWVRSMVATWKGILSTEGSLREEFVQERVRPALRELLADEQSISLEHVVDALPHVMSTMQIRVVNSGNAADSQIEWERFPFWVLVGGNKLDRGYTVEGLVTTFMPRGTGGGQADTIQQRARFFGYKDKYADLCRAWLTPDTRELYERYVEHEGALRKELERVASEGEDLKRWRRKMLIDSALKPCRASVIGLPYIRERVKGGQWSRFERLLIDPELIVKNRETLDSFLNRYGSTRAADTRDPRSEHRNQVVSLPLRQLLSELLADWEHDAVDGSTLNGASLLLGARLDERPELGAEVYLMRNLLPRERALSKSDSVKVNNLFEGYRPGAGGDNYPGDQAFHSDDSDVISLQVHLVTVKERERRYSSVPALALYVPRRLAGDLLLGPA